MINIDAYRERRLGAAGSQAAEALAAARTTAAARLTEGRRAADEILADARKAGEAAAAREADLELAAARREARLLVLTARREEYDRFCELSSVAVLALRAGPEYPRILDVLQARIRSQLGEDARIERDPPSAGGVVGESDGRRVDASLTALADACRGRLGGAIEALWAPAQPVRSTASDDVRARDRHER